VEEVPWKLARLTACADRIALLREELSAEELRRNELITDLRDGGLSWRSIATRARLSVSRCVAVVTGEI